MQRMGSVLGIKPEAIAEYKINGEQLFFPNAGK